MFGHPSYDLPVVLVFVAVVILPGTITSHRCACCRRACSCCPGSSVPVVFFVRVRAILVVAVDAHVPLGRVEVRAAVLHDGAVDDNVVLAGCELLEAFVHATFDPATLWQYLRHGLLQRSCSGAPITSPIESIAQTQVVAAHTVPSCSCAVHSASRYCRQTACRSVSFPAPPSLIATRAQKDDESEVLW